MGEFMAHYACKNKEVNLKSTTSNGFNFQIINLLMESWEGGSLTWLDCNTCIMGGMTVNVVCSGSKCEPI